MFANIVHNGRMWENHVLAEGGIKDKSMVSRVALTVAGKLCKERV